VLRDVLNPNPHAAAMRQRTSTDPVEPEIYEDPTTGVESLDGNTVDRADQMAKLAENQLLYDASVEMLKKKLGMLKYSISEGGGNH
jgi:flagellar basal body rod protein FlgB